jgi:hypothetical protein
MSDPVWLTGAPQVRRANFESQAPAKLQIAQGYLD